VILTGLVLAIVLTVGYSVVATTETSLRGGNMNDLIALLNSLSSSIASLQSQLADAQVAAQANYDAGVQAGKDSRNQEVEDLSAQMTQLTIDKANLQSQIDQLTADKAAMQTVIDSIPAQLQSKYDEGFAAGVASVPPSSGSFSQADVDAAVASAIAALKQSLKDAYEAQQVVESASETGFKDLLN